MIYNPGSRQIVTSEDVTFDEHFNTAIATTWQQHHDSLALRPVESYIPVVSETIEYTGNIDDFQPDVEEGDEPELENSSSDDESTAPKAIVAPPAPQPDSHPYVLDSSSSNQTLRRSTRNRKPNPRYAGSHFSNAVAWANTCSDQEIVEACAVEAQPAVMPDSQDAYSWEPAPKSIRDILKMPDGVVKTGWLKSVKKEMGTLVGSGTLVLDEMREGENSTPVMEIFKVKINSDGSLGKLKTRIVVRGDLQNGVTEVKWSPTASFRSLKMFLAHASRLKARVKQLDFIGAFLQASTRSRIFVMIPAVFGSLFKPFCGKLVRLAKSMYGMTLSGKYWWLDLLEFLLSLGFKSSKSVPCLLILTTKDGSIYILNYVDDMLYFGTKALQKRFNLELMGFAHWYLATRINQLANFGIELDQSRYCQSIVKKYLDTAGAKKVLSIHAMPLPYNFIPSAADCSVDEAKSKQLAEEYNIDYASCVGSLIYLGMTRVDNVYAVNKLAKFTHKPGKTHFEAIVHLLRYLRDHPNVGIHFYSDYQNAPMTKALIAENLTIAHPLFGFSDSSWNDDVDHGRSTGCFLITYMGGVVDHSSNLPDPVALSSAEAE
jgi:hypothetical protein